jgi:tetratricopeptide (TPR) repeat protein
MRILLAFLLLLIVPHIGHGQNKRQLNQIYKFQKKNDFLRVMKLSTELIKQDSNNVNAIITKATALRTVGNYDEAFQHINCAIAIDSTLPKAFAELGAIYVMQSLFDEGLRWIEKSIKMDNNYSSGYIMKGATLYSMSRYKEALQFYEIGVKLDQKNSLGYFNLGMLYYHFVNYEKASENYLSSIKIDKHHYRAYFNLGKCYHNLKDYRKAIKYLKKAKKGHSKNKDPWENIPIEKIDKYLRDAYLQLGKAEQAAKYSP